jgi:hypothetical protein
VLLLNECLLLLFISLSSQSGKFWIYLLIVEIADYFLGLYNGRFAFVFTGDVVREFWNNSGIKTENV